MRGDVLSEVPAALELRKDAQNEQEAKVRGEIILVGANELLDHFKFDAVMKGVDELFPGDEGAGFLAVRIQEHLGRSSERFSDKRKELQDRMVESLQLDAADRPAGNGGEGTAHTAGG
jgi:hypothetical protein